MNASLRVFIRNLFLFPPVTNLVVRLRHFWLRRKLVMHNQSGAVIAYDYSRKNVERLALKGRPLSIIRPLSAVEAASKNGKVLSIGCRYEEELFYLWAHGWARSNIRGFDLFSYSSWVDAGDMHAMPYPDASWDIAVCAQTLSYSHFPRGAANEIARVLKPGGVVAISVGYYTDAELARMEAAGTLIGQREGRLQTTDAILALFGPKVGTVWFRHDPRPDSNGLCSVIFSLS